MSSEISTENISRTLGQLEGKVTSLDSGVGNLELRFEQRFSALDARLDKVIFTMFGFGAALIAGMVGILVKLFI